MGRPVALAVFAHPDDAELACFGTFAALHQQGYALCVLSLTDGRNSIAEQSHLRPKEAKMAAEVVGSELIVEGFEDGFLAPNREIFGRIEAHIRRIQPSIVLTHYPGDREHQDHQVVGKITTAVANRSSDIGLVLQGEPPYHADSFTPQLYTDITDFMDLKMQALACYKSEADKRFMSRDLVTTRGKWWAHQAGVHGDGENPRFYEAFVVAKALLTFPFLQGPGRGEYGPAAGLS
ncbi:PIG-L deacetylase family protein [Amycolatopsis nigrescens]|uniref:PIG-L deacetylase family protein n=1 Tax=Amycolatopsis nigrescens TaxID=381445 RepID=UPI00036511AA|nr:PIG-L deacetylase family protein [Amycolatopsis nigrescens]